MKQVPSYSCDSQSINKNLNRDNLILIPVISGTLPNTLIRFDPTDYTTINFPLPLFPFNIIIQLLKDENIEEKYYSTKELKRFWYLNGLIPRSLEYSILVFKELLKKENISEEKDFYNLLFEKTINKLLSLYKFEYYYNEILIYYNFTGFEFEYNQQIKFEENFLKGIIYKNKNNQILFPYVVFNEIIPKELKLPKNLFPILKSQFNWILFEELILRIFTKRIEFFLKIKNNNNNMIELNELFKGLKGFSNLKINLKNVNNVYYKEELNYFSQKTINETKIDNKTNFYENNEIKIIKSKINSYLVDGRILCYSLNNEKIIILIQFKHKIEPSETNEDKLDISPLEWYKKTKLEFENKFKDHKIIYVFITNANIPKKSNEAIYIEQESNNINENDNDKKNETKKIPRENIFILDNSIAEEFFSPNLLPYFKNIDEKN
jgi:hypothetical protein